MMVQLDDAHIDFTKITDFDLFIFLFSGIKKDDISIVIDGVDPSMFQVEVDEKTNMPRLVNRKTGYIIDKKKYIHISSIMREINNIERNVKTPGNNEAKRYLIERARKKLQRSKRKKHDSQLESLIVSLVNTSEFKYNYETVLDLTIFQFEKSVLQIAKKIDFDNRMIGVYSGTVDVKKMKEEDMTWFSKIN